MSSSLPAWAVVSLVEDAWINGQATTANVSDLEDCAIAVDATYYLQLCLDSPPSREPLLSALGGLTGLDYHIRQDLEQWNAHKITPLFIFDGQTLHGQDEVAALRGKAANKKTDEAWNLYAKGEAEQAVTAFGANSGAFRVQTLYPMLQSILQENKLHFLVAPYNASAQIAYLDMIDSDQCAGVMGSQELLLYPINDGVIRSFDWENKKVKAIFKKSLIRSLNVNDTTFTDALLMTGTSFLSTYPPLQDTSDVLQQQDPTWLDRYRRAKMAVLHFVYIAESGEVKVNDYEHLESGEVKVNDYEHLTNDNLQYMGLQLPAELYHYLNVGLIGGRVLSGITHLQIFIAPTLDGTVSEEYKKLVTNQLVPIREQTLALLMPRLNRWISRQDVMLKVWYDDKLSQKLNHAGVQPNPIGRAATWDINESSFKKSEVTDAKPGSISFEVLSLLFPDFAKETFPKEKRIKGINSADEITSLAIWRFLQLRGYGYEAVLMAFELIRLGVLHAHTGYGEANGNSQNGADAEEGSSLLIGRCASLLKLRHEANGYTGPLSKPLLYFRSLSTTVREADRDLIEAIVASMFLHAQSKRDRDDYLTLKQRLPFLHSPDVALGIAVKTFLTEVSTSDTPEVRQARLSAFPANFVPNAINFAEDLEMSLAFFDAIGAGVETLSTELSADDKASWRAARDYRDARRV
ncbi:Protein MKT1 like protein [Verticillium longisporum]|uniref:Protein MKT1 like protein n=1 Tax=Verticillium longisporum TaxID=100787 RepID=A0A8I3AF29_VERLO|nr:Protein MKT1 like protein [Verticillium longisporum]